MDQKDQYVILNRMLKGSREEAMLALGILYKEFAQPLFEYLFLLLDKDESWARDIVQDTFLLVFEKRHLFNHSLPFRPWLFRIASNRIKNDFRKQDVYRKNQAEIARNYDHFSTPEPMEISPETIWELVDRLGQDQKEVIILRYRTCLQVKEISGITGIPEGTVKSRIFYALKVLSSMIKKEETGVFNFK